MRSRRSKSRMHTALVDADIARRMEDSGIDAAMMDVIGAQDTISQVYHLKRSVADFERALECLTATSMKVVPHIVIGLHYGRMLGEWEALEIVARHQPDGAGAGGGDAVLCAGSTRPFVTPDPREVGRFFMDAREALPDMPLLLGCARPRRPCQGADRRLRGDGGAERHRASGGRHGRTRGAAGARGAGDPGVLFDRRRRRGAGAASASAGHRASTSRA